MASTLGQIKQRITDKVGDGNFINPTSAQIVDTINQTITYYEDKPFWFNESEAEITLVAGDKFVPVLQIPDDFKQVIEPNGLVVLVSNVLYTLIHLKPIEFDRIDVGGTGIPRYYTYRDGATDAEGGFQLYPYPDQAYQLNLYYRIYYEALIDDSDTNPMTQYADRLIEYKALADILRDYRSDDERASKYDGGQLENFNGGMAGRALKVFLNESYNRSSSGNLMTENIINEDSIYNF